MNEWNEALTFQRYGFTAKSFSDDCTEEALSVINNSVECIKRSVFTIDGEQRKNQFAKSVVEEWEKNCQDSFRKLQIEAQKIFYVNDSEIRIENDDDINQLKKETDELYERFLREKWFIAKLKAKKEQILSNLRESKDKTLILERLRNRQDEIQKFINCHSVRLDQVNLGNRYQKFSSIF